MDGLVVGLDLRDAYTKICVYNEEKTWTLPTVICRKKTLERWMVGEEGFASALDGSGAMVDKLVTQVLKQGTATIGGVCYQGRELMERFLSKVLELPALEFGTEEVSQLVVTMPVLHKELTEEIMGCAQRLGLPKERVHVISHGESFVYYVLSQKKDIWSNQVGLFDLTNEDLYYHELKVQRGMKKTAVQEESVRLEESFNLNVLDSVAGAKLADTILCSCGDRLLQRKLFSSIFLTGKGFESQKWAGGFMKLLCSRRKVFAEQDLFAAGAALRGADLNREKTSYPFVMVCPGRLSATVSLAVEHKERMMELVAAQAGDSWYEAGSTMEFIVDRQDFVEFHIQPADDKKARNVKIPLEGFPNRPERTTRISVQIRFSDERTMWVSIKDLGFGELFPAGDAKIVQEVRI